MVSRSLLSATGRPNAAGVHAKRAPGSHADVSRSLLSAIRSLLSASGSLLSRGAAGELRLVQAQRESAPTFTQLLDTNFHSTA